MPPRREPPQARSPRSRYTDSETAGDVRGRSWPATVVGVSVLTLALTVTQPASGTSRVAGASVASTSASVAVAALRTADPQPVTPTVIETGVPRVPASQQKAIPSGLDLRDHGGETVADGRERLAGHLVQSVNGAEMVGLTWTAGTAPPGLEVQVRGRGDGEWSDWTDAHADPDEGPAAGDEGVVRDGTAPVWLGSSQRVEVAVLTGSGKLPRQLRLQAIDPGTSSYDAVAAEQPAAGQTTQAKVPPGTFPALPEIITRRQWGADNSLNQCGIEYGNQFKAVFVHHTVGTNSYSRSESAALVRGIHAYHTQSRGWCDIGYNFLVDKYGQVFEGRRGGIRKPVRGAHAGDYNGDSTGISLMGNFESTNAPKRMKTALVRLIAWRVGTAYRGAYGRAVIQGEPFKRISGHRDAMSTACPGQTVYDWLPLLRERVHERLRGFSTPLRRTWTARGGTKGIWGPVRIGEQGTHGGRFTAFRGGRIYAYDGGLTGLRTGEVLTRFRKSGGVSGELGYPVSIVRTQGDGKAVDFRGGSIFWSPETGARILRTSAILKRYRALDAAKGRLGFPRTPVVSFSWGARTRFEHGSIRFDKATHEITVTYS